MALSFLAHVVLRTPLPQTDQQLRDRSWKMKQKFADTIDHRPPTVPHLWGVERRMGIQATPYNA